MRKGSASSKALTNIVLGAVVSKSYLLNLNTHSNQGARQPINQYGMPCMLMHGESYPYLVTAATATCLFNSPY